jgi:hypothetical protein
LVQRSNNQFRKCLYGIVLVGMILISNFGMSNSPMVRAQEQATATAMATLTPDGTGSPTAPAQVATPQAVTPTNEYFSTTTIELEDGRQIEGIIIHGPPYPPAGFDRPTASTSEIISALGAITLTVPAFDWSFGCSATSGSMIAAYYDRDGYPNMYTGPTDSGVMPLNSGTWPDWTDGHGDTYGQCPLTASRNGLDGRLTRGSIDDYWVAYGSSAPDPYITNGWVQHTWGDSIGDYMKTSQSSYDNTDGSTVFYNWISSSSPLTCSDITKKHITIMGDSPLPCT